MNIAIVEPKTGVIVNVIVAKDVKHAQSLFSEFLCVVRDNLQPMEPEGLIESDGTIKRAIDVLQSIKDDARKNVNLFTNKI